MNHPQLYLDPSPGNGFDLYYLINNQYYGADHLQRRDFYPTTAVHLFTIGPSQGFTSNPVFIQFANHLWVIATTNEEGELGYVEWSESLNEDTVLEQTLVSITPFLVPEYPIHETHPDIYPRRNLDSFRQHVLLQLRELAQTSQSLSRLDGASSYTLYYISSQQRPVYNINNEWHNIISLEVENIHPSAVERIMRINVNDWIGRLQPIFIGTEESYIIINNDREVLHTSHPLSEIRENIVTTVIPIPILDLSRQPYRHHAGVGLLNVSHSEIVLGRHIWELIGPANAQLPPPLFERIEININNTGLMTIETISLDDDNIHSHLISQPGPPGPPGKDADPLLKESVTTLMNQLYGIPVTLPEFLVINGLHVKFISYEDAIKMFDRNEITRYIIDPLIQPWAGRPGTSKRILTLFLKNGMTHLVRVRHDPKDNRIYSPQ